jgi:serine/threonine protein kinase/class 3 adenylate cyclase
MQLEGHRLLAQVGAGSDGIAYRGEAADGTPVEVRVLAGARADPERWAALCRRLRLAALVRHPAAVAVRSLHLLHDPPFVVLEWAQTPTLAERLRGRVPLAAPEAYALARALAEGLAAAHRLGLGHGGLGPETVLLSEAGRPRVDFTGIDVGGPGGCRPAAADPAADSAGLGRILRWLLTGREVDLPDSLPKDLDHTAGALLAALLAAEAADRLPAREAAERLAGLLAAVDATRYHESSPQDQPTSGDVEVKAAPAGEALPHQQLGRFRLLEKLGQGGMGAVYRAEDVSDGTVVAVKVLRADRTEAQAVRRFHKEARLLAEIGNPHVVNLLEVNEDAGVHYLALEYVAGRTLGRLLAERGRLEEREAVAILADVCRGLSEAHARGIVHRDVKPDNILLQELTTNNTNQTNQEERQHGEGDKAGEGPASSASSIRVIRVIRGSFLAKLSDFGLARHVVETASLEMTRAGAIMGTLPYMSPEQCAGAALDARADVYSLGATLFHLLAGRRPFVADSTLGLIALHTKEPPPPLRQFNPAVSDGVCQIINRALAKAPEARYADAGAMLEDLERLLRGEPTGMDVHPRRPAGEAGSVLRYEWVWDLEASPAQLWPHVSNTERLNRAAGLVPVQFQTRIEEGEGPPRVRRFGEFKKAGIAVNWEEHPFEWIEGRRMGVLREYSTGPFRWLLSVVEMEPRGGGTRLTHRVEIEPRGVLGRTLAAVEVGVRGRRSVERVYRRIDAALTGAAAAPYGRALVDPFEDPAAPTRAQRQRLERLLDDLIRRGVSPEVAERLVDFVAHAPPQEVGRIRPLALARRLGLDPAAVVDACLHGAHAGLLVLLWDVLCPVCRIPAAVKDTLRLLREHESCPACVLDFRLDFGSSVELIFRAHPEVRASELGTYCIGGPAHSPHVVAQARVAAGERMELTLSLTRGAYRLRGPQLPYVLDFRVEEEAGVRRWDLALSRPPEAGRPRVLRAGRQVLMLGNDGGRELVVRVERAAPRDDALTAARASALALFRELFPGEILSPGQLISVATVALLVTELEGAGELYARMGDARAFAVIHEHFRLLRERIAAEGGALVKTVAEGVVAAFAEAEAAVRAGLALQADLAGQEATRGLCLRAGIHRGPALAATLNDHLDYFGTTVRQALELPGQARGGGLLLTEAVAGDPAVAALLRSRGLEGALEEAELAEGPAVRLQRLAFPPSAS